MDKEAEMRTDGEWCYIELDEFTCDGVYDDGNRPLHVHYFLH